MKLILKTLIIYLVAIPLALAQTSDSGAGTESYPGSERARLGNERIQAEIELRAREEQRRLEEEAQARLRAEEAAARSAMAATQNPRPEMAASGETAATQNPRPEVPASSETASTQNSRPEMAASREMAATQNPKPEPTEAADSDDIYRTLEQLRMLGELKDDGYISDEEFQRIKRRILDDQT